MEKGHKKLEIYQIAHGLAIQIHNMTLILPSFERYEEGSQIRRSSKSISSNIVEGYALRRYKNEFVHFLFRAYGSGEETLEHLEILFDSKSVSDDTLFNQLHQDCNNLCGKILRYIQAVDQHFEKPTFMKDPLAEYITDHEHDEPPMTTANLGFKSIEPEFRTPNPEPRTSS